MPKSQQSWVRWFHPSFLRRSGIWGAADEADYFSFYFQANPSTTSCFIQNVSAEHFLEFLLCLSVLYAYRIFFLAPVIFSFQVLESRMNASLHILLSIYCNAQCTKLYIYVRVPYILKNVCCWIFFLSFLRWKLKKLFILLMTWT
jgi:hypothetical protein